MPASRTAETLRPAQRGQIVATGLFAGEAYLELEQVAWIILHEGAYYILGSPESSGYPIYRDFLTVALVIRRDGLFPDNWIYIHEPSVKMGRIQNYGNWSPEMVADPKTSCLGLEYFCFEGDDLWTSSQEQLIDLGKRELATLGLADPGDVIDAAVVRMKKAYPVYNRGYDAAVAKVRAFLATLPNLQLVGRNGMHRYNNQDHSMLTAMLAARNIVGGHYDLWQVNVDQEYHEEGREISLEELRSLESTQPLVPRKIDQ